MVNELFSYFKPDVGFSRVHQITWQTLLSDINIQLAQLNGAMSNFFSPLGSLFCNPIRRSKQKCVSSHTSLYHCCPPLPPHLVWERSSANATMTAIYCVTSSIKWCLFTANGVSREFSWYPSTSLPTTVVSLDMMSAPGCFQLNVLLHSPSFYFGNTPTGCSLL